MHNAYTFDWWRFIWHYNFSAATCPADYTTLPSVNLCVKFYQATGNRQYSALQTLCQNDGGHLVKIHNSNEQDALATWLGKNDLAAWIYRMQN